VEPRLAAPMQESQARAHGVVAAAGVIAALVVHDLWTVLQTPPWPAPSFPGLVVFAATSWGVGTVLAVAFVLLRGELRRTLAGRRAGPACAGALDASAIFALAVVGHSPAPLAGWPWFLILPPFLVVGAVAGALTGRLRPRPGRMLAAAVAVASAAALPLLHPIGEVFLRLALHAACVAAVAAALGGVRIAGRPVAAGLGLALALAALSNPLVAASSDARAALHARSVQARAWFMVAIWLTDRDRDGAPNLFGGRDCDGRHPRIFPGAAEIPGSGRDENCSGGDARPPPARPVRVAPGHGAAAGSDVLLLSIDSLRWDVTDELRDVRATLGAHADLRRAVSPTPKTVTSLASTLRGRSYRQVRFETAPGLRGKVPARDPSATLAGPLVRAGYRVLAAPTHAYVDPRTRVAAGFETVAARGWPGARPFVPAPDALDAVRMALIGTDGPVCAWVHLMESHHPYRYGGRSGPDSPAGLRSSVRWLDRRLGRFLRDIRRTGRRSPIVAVFGDHGEEFGEHGGRLHASTVFAEQVRVALLLAGPGVSPGRYDAPVTTASIPATVLDLVGVAAPTSMTEPSLLPFLSGETPWPDLAVSESRSTRIAVGYTSSRFRLVSDPVFGVEMLFDSEADPLEQRDLAAALPADLARMRRLAHAWDEAH